MPVVVRRFGRLAPPLGWMGVIALFSSRLFGSEETGAWVLPLMERLFPWAEPGVLHALHAAVRKLGHLVEYGILAALWLRALEPGPGAAARAVVYAALYAGVDEVHQSFEPNRTAAPLDVVIDTVGAFIAVAWLRGPARLGRAGVRVVRWGAVLVAVGSLLAAVLDWALGLTAWDLVLAAAGATAAAWALARLEAAWRSTA